MSLLRPSKLIPWLLAAGVAWSAGFYYNARFGGGISWLRIMYENKMAIASQIEGPRRLLIVGGSGAHYTVNSQLMEKYLGFPVINLGLDGNLGLNVIFPLILEQVKAEDIILLIPEYLMLLDPDGIGERSGRFALALGRPDLGRIPAKQLAQDFWLLGVPSLRALTKSTLDVLQNETIPDYYADPLTERGDPTKTWERKGKWWQLKLNKPISAHSIQKIQQFREDLAAKEAHLILSMPVIYGSSDAKTLGNAQKSARQLEKIAPLLYDPETFNLSTDSDRFADTHYHLKPEARRLRSLELVQQLQPVLEALPAAPADRGL